MFDDLAEFDAPSPKKGPGRTEALVMLVIASGSQVAFH
jgi:hypothetical protein